ncbi:MAG: hypothetical protein ACI8TP_003729 [Acidimicrobiales bacterium]|jgi:hypothetical protein
MNDTDRGPSSLLLDLSLSSSLELWRSFEEASEQAERLGCDGRVFWVYVVELGNHLNLDKPEAPTVWVGQTHLEPAERLAQHRNGHRADPRVAMDGTALRTDLFQKQPELRTRQEADTYQALLAETLNNNGYSVYVEA